jgi:hypothetical protein
MQCTAVKLNGESCQAQALTNDTKCHFHSDAARENRRAAQAKGGLSTAGKIKQLIPTHLTKDVPDVRLDSAADAKLLIEKVTNWTLKGAIATPVATVVVNALGVFVRLVEATEVDAKIRELEERLKPAA